LGRAFDLPGLFLLILNERTGADASLLSQHDHQVTAIELSAEAI
jgi:hypothetical protein